MRRLRAFARSNLLALAVALCLAGACERSDNARGDPFEDPVSAYRAGDYAAALRIWRVLVEQGGAAAQFNLGVMYTEGLGVPQDDAEAVRWYRKAADQGDAQAQHNLGVMYTKGRGVPQDYVQAHMWLNLAASRGVDPARKVRDALAGFMTPAQIAEAQQLARSWQPR